ncbi:Hypothetical protein, predicted transmembrane protein [Mycoplasma mycoides subsp. capri LC str. 95010]|uniref:Uncharacterized protein n=1 Tax=Mycoplasma mycoides subsp. capri LC str. 95010 TaxID=862259 RepID=F4MNX6_MYCML|nr:hypothetical protein [Mycoplasma mycoides]CBW53808.1 Hypothetical protein, predicted transmembrane protein [Mycoplasma mycoides subsp. capri LC str. 95010]
MKKLLTILGSLAIISSGAGVIVSYNKTNASSSEIKKVEEEIIKPTDPNNFTINKSKSTWQDIFRDSITGADIFSYSSKNKKDDKKDAEAKFIKDLRDLTPNTDKEQSEWVNRKHNKAIKDFIRDLRDLTPNTDSENKAWSHKKADEAKKKEEANKKDAEAKFIKDLRDLTPNTDAENKEWISRKLDEIRKEAEANFIRDLRDLTPNTDAENKAWSDKKAEDKIKKEIDAQIDKEESQDFDSEMSRLNEALRNEIKYWESRIKNEIDKLVEKDEAEDFSKEFNEEVNRLDDALKAEFKKWVDEINKIKKEVDAQIDKENEEDLLIEISKFSDALEKELNEKAYPSEIKKEIDELIKKEEIEDEIAKFFDDLAGLTPNTDKEQAEWASRKHKEFVKKVTDKFISDLRDLTPNTDVENKEWAEPSVVKNEIDKLVEKDEAEDFRKEFNEEINRLDGALKAEFKKWVDEINKIKKEVDAQIDREETEDAINDFINDLEGLIPNTNKNEPDLDEWLKQNKKQNDQIKELLEKTDKKVLNEYIPKIIHTTKESRKYLTFEGKWVSDLLTSKLKRVLLQLNK